MAEQVFPRLVETIALYSPKTVFFIYNNAYLFQYSGGGLGVVGDKGF